MKTFLQTLNFGNMQLETLKCVENNLYLKAVLHS